MHPVVVCLVVVSAVAFAVLLVLRARKQKGVTGFFHPYCNDGGGGERVLWYVFERGRKKESGFFVRVECVTVHVCR